MKDDIEDLSALARRGQLSEHEAHRLNELLNASAEERFWHQLASACDTEAAADSDDHDATARVVSRVLGELPRRRSKFVRYRGLSIAATLLLAVSASAAIVVSARHSRDEAQEAPSGQRASASVPSGASTKATPIASAPLDSADAPAAIPSPSSEIVKPPETPERAREEIFDKRSAAELLSAAGQARRRGNAKQAMELLQQLQSRFPNSSEAKASDIALGKLRLQSGSARSALMHFERYLKRSPRGELAPEAIWGRAQAMLTLGNQAEARRSLLELVERYPHSPYTSAANAKLRSLEAR